MDNKSFTDRSMLTRLFFRLLPVQVLIVAMESINAIADGITATHFIDISSVGVVGLYYTMVRIMEAVSAVMAGGTAVICGKYLGRGDRERTDGIFSLNLTVTLLIGAVMTAVGVLFPFQLARMLGANADLTVPLMNYITGYSIGIIPQLLSQQLTGFLQLERQGKRCYAGISSMIITNVALDILLVAVFHMGVFGLALATSAANWIYFIILIQYYLTGRSQLEYKAGTIMIRELWDLVSIGFPGALLVFCLAARSLVLNRLLLTYSGSNGLSAMSSFNMICGLFIATALGTGAVVRMLTSVFCGEEDMDSIISLFKIVFSKAVPIAAVIGFLVFVFAPFLSGLYFSDHTSEVFRLTSRLFRIYSICVPMVMLCTVFNNYLQSIGHSAYVNFLSIFDGFFSNVIPSMLLAPKLGATGVFLSLPIGIAATMLLSPLYSIIRRGHIPKNLYEWLFLDRLCALQPEKRHYRRSLHEDREVMETAGELQDFCISNGIGKREAFHTALCFEELANNVFKHGFRADKRSHTVDLNLMIRAGEVMMRIKDDCLPFDPKEIAEMTDGLTPDKNIGIRLVYGVASDVTYQNLVGLNVLTIHIAQDAGDHGDKGAKG